MPPATFTQAMQPTVPLFENPASNIDPRLSQSEAQAIPPQLASFTRVPTQPHTGPAFASHMADIYTTQIALEERMRETGRQQEATRLESKRKVQQTVFVYAWMEVRSYSLSKTLNS